MAVGALVLLYALLSISALFLKSPTYDEPMHLFAGYSYIRWGDFRANTEHPPLVKIWAALPLLTMKIEDPRALPPKWAAEESTDERAYGLINSVMTKFFVLNNPESLFFYAKLQMTLIGICY